MVIPLQVGDFTDFSSSKNHAFNIGIMFRGKDNIIYPNFAHMPIAYHSRASSLVVSGTPIRRPKGQVSLDKQRPIWSATHSLDFELELATVVGRANDKPVKMCDASEHIFGYTLLNDWSARDILTWEYVPLGPFNSKNFGTSISPWIITAEALEPFKLLRGPMDP